MTALASRSLAIPRPRLAPRILRLVGRFVAELVARDKRWREREAMRRIDDRILRDIGVTRADLDAALRAPGGLSSLRRHDQL
jgi:uncharacterized protein YjiS (DUF1127 family)